LLLISHLHADHFDKEAKEILNKKLKTISPFNNKKMLLEWGFINTVSLQWNETITLTKENETLKIIAIKAVHAADKKLNIELGEVNGYIIEHNAKNKIYRIYWSGDTIWFDDIKKIKQYGSIDLFIPNMGAVGVDGDIGRRGLDAIECIKIIEYLKPKLITPVHHSTFSHYIEPISILQEMLSKTEHKNTLKIIKENESINLSEKMKTTIIDTKTFQRKYYTKEYEVKNSSLVEILPNYTFLRSAFSCIIFHYG
jgi:N-acyl-phosphatidylethanolamine-hydrolysing phospholipase D